MRLKSELVFGYMSTRLVFCIQNSPTKWKPSQLSQSFPHDLVVKKLGLIPPA